MEGGRQEDLPGIFDDVYLVADRGSLAALLCTPHTFPSRDTYSVRAALALMVHCWI